MKTKTEQQRRARCRKSVHRAVAEKMKYDIYFNDETSSNNKGFQLTFQECLNYIETHNGTNESYFADYKGGTVSIVNIETGETEYETEVL